MRPGRPLLSRADVPDALFASDNRCGIPSLLATLQADFVDLPVTAWGSVSRTTEMPGTWHFYVDDYRFNALWSDPSPVVNSGCVAVIEPNFTTSEQMPFAVALYRIYQKRWLARYWQQYGIRVFVDMNVAEPWYGFNLLGVPRGWTAYATRGYKDRIGSLMTEYELAREHANVGRSGQPILFAVYGGGQAVADYCRRLNWTWIPEQSDIAKGRRFDG